MRGNLQKADKTKDMKHTFAQESRVDYYLRSRKHLLAPHDSISLLTAYGGKMKASRHNDQEAGKTRVIKRCLSG